MLRKIYVCIERTILQNKWRERYEKAVRSFSWKWNKHINQFQIHVALIFWIFSWNCPCFFQLTEKNWPFGTANSKPQHKSILNRTKNQRNNKQFVFCSLQQKMAVNEFIGPWRWWCARFQWASSLPYQFNWYLYMFIYNNAHVCVHVLAQPNRNNT